MIISPFKDLRTNIIRCAQLSLHDTICMVQELGKSKVNQFYMDLIAPLANKDHILRFEISVNNLLCMKVTDG